MSMYYSPEIVKLVMEERLTEARRIMLTHCCEDALPARRPSRFAAIRSLFRRESPAACNSAC
jgi:hypothetical protein